MMHSVRAFAFFFSLMLYASMPVLADNTTQFFLDPANDAIVP